MSAAQSSVLLEHYLKQLNPNYSRDRFLTA
jgi:hypothetical protein